MSEIISNRLSSLKVVELRKELRKYELNAGGKKAELKSRLLKYLVDLEQRTRKDEHAELSSNDQSNKIKDIKEQSSDKTKESDENPASSNEIQESEEKSENSSNSLNQKEQKTDIETKNLQESKDSHQTAEKSENEIIASTNEDSKEKSSLISKAVPLVATAVSESTQQENISINKTEFAKSVDGTEKISESKKIDHSNIETEIKSKDEKSKDANTIMSKQSTSSKHKLSSPRDSVKSQNIKRTEETEIIDEEEIESSAKRQKKSATDVSDASDMRDVLDVPDDIMSASLKITIGNDPSNLNDDAKPDDDESEKSSHTSRIVHSAPTLAYVSTIGQKRRSVTPESSGFAFSLPETNESSMIIQRNSKRSRLENDNDITTETISASNVQDESSETPVQKPPIGIRIREPPRIAQKKLTEEQELPSDVRIFEPSKNIPEERRKNKNHDDKIVRPKLPRYTTMPVDKISDSDESDDEPQEDDKDIPVPICKNPKSPSLRINGFVRPLRDDDVKKMLSRFGKFEQFMMNDIKTYCYVTFPTIEESENCRKTIWGRIWPKTPHPGQVLKADFVRNSDVENEMDRIKRFKLRELEKAELISRQQQNKSSRANYNYQENRNIGVKSKKHQIRSTSQDIIETKYKNKEHEKSKNRLEELFRKTVAKPQIYWTPLTDEQVKLNKSKETENKSSTVVDDKSSTVVDDKSNDRDNRRNSPRRERDRFDYGGRSTTNTRDSRRDRGYDRERNRNRPFRDFYRRRSRSPYQQQRRQYGVFSRTTRRR